MNKKLFVIAALNVIALDSYAQTKTLEVKGIIGSPGVCQIEATNEGTYNFGAISSSLIHKTARVPLASPQMATWKVQCATVTSVSFTTSDSAKSTALQPELQFFGLGSVNSDGKLGMYTVTAKNPMVDNKPALFSTHVSAVEGKSIALLQHGVRSTWARSDAASTQATGQEFSADLEVSATLGAETTDMKGAPPDGTALNGRLTMTFKQGL
jgi:hypothetical protein